jgi:RNA polymerase sigma-70 factor (ECF subfamily)
VKDTDWNRIVGLYDVLMTLRPSPVVALNRAIAVSMCRGPEEGLRELGPLEAPLAGYHLYHATRADFLERAGRDPQNDLRRALDLATNDGERKLLERRLGALGRGSA